MAHPGQARWKVDIEGVVSARSYNERVAAIGYTQEQMAAIDIMTDDGVPLEKAAALALGATKNGQNAEAAARHFVKLRKAFRGES